MTVAETLHETAVTELDLSRYVISETHETTADTIEKMCAARYSCALVTDAGKLVGIFTQRDVLMRVVGTAGAADQPIGEAMTDSPRTVKATQSVAEALSTMTELWVRSVPVVGDDGAVIGNVSFYVLMKLIADLLADHALGTPTEVSAHHGLEFIDFTGLNTSAPVTVHEDDSLEAAVHQMKSRALGSVFVVDHREHLVGVVTEFDLQTRGAWKVADLADRSAVDYMTPDPVTLSARSSVASAVQEMAATGSSHVPLLGESGRPIGVASFRDVADYFETSVAILD